jgi:ArsR family transcriptional regulator, lead/cadmium/zinc/bismuth-responsive transcriptional repressor
MAENDTQIAPIDAEAVAKAVDAIPSEAHLATIYETFQVLANVTRLRILYALLEQSLCVRDIAIVVGVSESAVSHQLRHLRDQRIVKTRREKNVIYYTLDDQHVAALLREADFHADHIQQGLQDHPYTLDHRSP